ncbi:MAG: pantetheine-phosphate adenylyltransferase [Clostridia bacterium]|nr:pantetheine-phosphate adenylyltransferase [Clostridia bacterium]
MAIAVCPGSFDPVTMGHVDIVTRASRLFDKVYVAVMKNPAKTPAFSAEERKALLSKALKGIENIEIITFDGLLVDLAAEKDATVIVKGLRAVSDYEYEFQMALANHKLNSNVETVFLTTSSENMFLSSSTVKQIACFGGEIRGLVPDCVCEDIKERLYLGGRVENGKK